MLHKTPAYYRNSRQAEWDTDSLSHSRWRLWNSSISALSQVSLFRFSSNTREAELNNPSLSTLVQGADRYARSTSVSAGKWLLLYIYILHSKTLILSFFNHSLVERLVCLGLLSCCMTQVLLRLSSRSDVLTFSFRICWNNSEFIVPSIMVSHSGPDAAKQAQTMILPPPCFTDGIRFLCWNAVFSFSKHNSAHLNQKDGQHCSFWRAVAFSLLLCHGHHGLININISQFEKGL